MFETLVSSCGRWVGLRPRPNTHPTEQPERRVWVRYPCEVEAVCQVAHAPDKGRFSARVRDVSRGGIHLVVDQAFQPGMLLSIELPGTSEDLTSTVLTYVVRVTPQGKGEWSCGCTFATELGDDDLEPFGVIGIRAGGNDPRTWVRLPCQAQASFQVIRAIDPQETPAKVLDISPGGIGLLVAQPVEVGTLLSLELQDKTAQYFLNILSSVVRTTPRPDGQWVLGCNFIREITEQEMLALL